MVVKIYISGISGNKEVKKRQQRVLMICDSKNIKYEVIDITEPGREADKDFMQNNAKSLGGTVSDPKPRSPLPPQMFNDEEYCGDYDEFDLANEVDTLEQFLKVEVPPETPQPETEKEKALNGDVEVDNNDKSKEPSQEKDVAEGKSEPDSSADAVVTEKEKSPSKEGSVPKENSPLRVDGDKEGSPAKDDANESAKETTPEKESSPQRQKSVEMDEVVDDKAVSKENTPEKENLVNENGTLSSREQSEEKEAEVEESSVPDRKKDNPSEALIQSEQAVAAE